MKKIIGLVPSSNKLFKTDFVYDDQYIFTNNYAQSITKAGGIVCGVIPCDGYINAEDLKIYDGFVMSGGCKVFPYHLQIIDYAIKNKKPFLGVCMGMQALAIYFLLLKEKKIRKYDGDILQLFNEIVEKDDKYFTIRVQGHNNDRFKRNNANIDKIKHKVILNKESTIYKIYQKEIIDEPSLHGVALPYVAEPLKITGKSKDDVIEVIEYNDITLGVQFHPENESINECLFKYIIDRS